MTGVTTSGEVTAIQIDCLTSAMLQAHIEALRNGGLTDKRSSPLIESDRVIKQQKLGAKDITALLDEIDALECEPCDVECSEFIPRASIQSFREVEEQIQASPPRQLKAFDDFEIDPNDFTTNAIDHLYVPRFTASSNSLPRVVDMIPTLPLEQHMHRHLFAPTLLSHNLASIRGKYPLASLHDLIRAFPPDKRIVKSPKDIPFALMIQSHKGILYDTMCTLTDNVISIHATISRTVTEALTSTTKLTFGTVLVLHNASFVNHGEWHMCVVRRNMLAVYHNAS
jgi:hypothetical protein